MTCIHCHQKIRTCLCGDSATHYVTTEDLVPTAVCEKSNEGDHEPEPEDKQ